MAFSNAEKQARFRKRRDDRFKELEKLRREVVNVMTNVLSYHVFNAENGHWLADDEKTWTPNFLLSASFTSFEIANDIMQREGGDYVFACMGSA
jgi:hypothetical protein